MTTLTVLTHSLFDTMFRWLPFYYLFKSLVFLWVIHPDNSGSITVFGWVESDLLKFERFIEKTIVAYMKDIFSFVFIYISRIFHYFIVYCVEFLNRRALAEVDRQLNQIQALIEKKPARTGTSTSSRASSISKSSEVRVSGEGVVGSRSQKSTSSTSSSRLNLQSSFGGMLHSARSKVAATYAAAPSLSKTKTSTSSDTSDKIVVSVLKKSGGERAEYKDNLIWYEADKNLLSWGDNKADVFHSRRPYSLRVVKNATMAAEFTFLATSKEDYEKPNGHTRNTLVVKFSDSNDFRTWSTTIKRQIDRFNTSRLS
eukprot:CAMPEP_0114993990 /NCGR_PEP_ID=MMETSP0216-20121206/12857_1 /TAXON_ID=223996 /ORGANISM="Protocruzia adherens, Strain Boccale" /LENGTH=312 /DNA_ID=CAMNT_0002357735 /DNA_START=300 /DNA_END=1238 /DNA_ORIENTATION=-